MISDTTEPVNEDVECFGDGVHLPHTIKDDVYSGDENLPDTVEREEIAQEVEVHSLTGLGPLDPLQSILDLVSLQEEKPGEFLQCGHLGFQDWKVVWD